MGSHCTFRIDGVSQGDKTSESREVCPARRVNHRSSTVQVEYDLQYRLVVHLKVCSQGTFAGSRGLVHSRVAAPRQHAARRDGLTGRPNCVSTARKRNRKVVELRMANEQFALGNRAEFQDFWRQT